jgi:voltage-gated potassium channel
MSEPDRAAVEDRSARWTRRTEYPLAAAAAVFLAAYAIPILDPTLSHPARTACTLIVYVVWALFAVDYIARFVAAPRKGHFFVRNLLDFASIALPVLRPLRLLRLVALVRILNRKATASLHGRVAVYVGFSAVLIIFVAALAILDAERGKAHSNINGFGDALWWAASTVMTVGYGDRYPVTTTGRLVGVGLMIAGITLLGVVTASIASWLINRVRDVEDDAVRHADRRFDELQGQIRDLQQLVVALNDRNAGQGNAQPSG